MHNSEDADESEFGLGMGMIDPTNRENRLLESWQEMTEIKSLPKTFDNSNPNRPLPEETPVPRLLPGETEADRA